MLGLYPFNQYMAHSLVDIFLTFEEMPQLMIIIGKSPSATWLQTFWDLKVSAGIWYYVQKQT